MQWSHWLSVDPMERLLRAEGALPLYVQKHLLDRDIDLVGTALETREVRGYLRNQRDDGSWGPADGRRSETHARLVSAYKNFRRLVHHYELGRGVPVVAKAAEFLFSHQTEEGDIRGMIGGQYATYYTGEFISLLIQAGYGQDDRVERGLRWLLGIRQSDGGWTIPILTRGLSWGR